MALRLSVLDQSPIAEGGTGGQALRNSVDLAKLTDGLGYSRYWVAEHHGMPMLASAAPEILIAEIAAQTEHIRVGSGGVMLPHYSPFKVAETFSILGGLHGDRIDLGIGRAPGSDRETMFALQRLRIRLEEMMQLQHEPLRVVQVAAERCTAHHDGELHGGGQGGRRVLQLANAWGVSRYGGGSLVP